METTQESLQKIKQILSVLLDKIENKNNICKETPNYNDTVLVDAIQEPDNKFARRRLTFVLVGSIGSMLLTYIMYLNFLPLFNIAFGLMLAFLCMFLVILFDEFILPGDTIEKISQSAIASSIVILAFAIIVVGGAQIGSGLITSRTQGEEPTPERVAVSNTNGQLKQDTAQIGFDKPSDQIVNPAKVKEQ